MLLSITLSGCFLLWGAIYEMWYWGKTLEQAIIDSWWNWILFFVFLGLTAYLSIIEEHLSFRKKKEEMVDALIRTHKGKTAYIQVPKSTLQELELMPKEEPVFAKTVPEVISIEDRPSETISTTKVETYKPAIIECPHCKQPVLEEELIKVINHRKGVTEYMTPCHHQVVREVKTGG